MTVKTVLSCKTKALRKINCLGNEGNENSKKLGKRGPGSRKRKLQNNIYCIEA